MIQLRVHMYAGNADELVVSAQAIIVARGKHPLIKPVAGITDLMQLANFWEVVLR